MEELILKTGNLFLCLIFATLSLTACGDDETNPA